MVTPTQAHSPGSIRMLEHGAYCVYQCPVIARVDHIAGLAVFYCFRRATGTPRYAGKRTCCSFEQNDSQSFDVEPKPPIGYGQTEDIGGGVDTRRVRIIHATRENDGCSGAPLESPALRSRPRNDQDRLRDSPVHIWKGI